MNIHRRRIVAFIASNLMRSSKGTLVIHDINPPHTTNYTGEISPSLIAIFDPDRQDYVLGHHHPPNLIRLTDLASEHPIDLTIADSGFEGLDHETGLRFRGSVNHEHIQFFDPADESTYEYKV